MATLPALAPSLAPKTSGPALGLRCVEFENELGPRRYTGYAPVSKAIGALARAGIAANSGFFLITSRCSFEMVAKAAIFGAGTLVSVSAPTSLALERARRFGVSVIAVARGDHALWFEGGPKASGGLAA